MGKLRYQPFEWYLVSLTAINDVVERIVVDPITDYIYDVKSALLIARS